MGLSQQKEHELGDGLFVEGECRSSHQSDSCGLAKHAATWSVVMVDSTIALYCTLLMKNMSLLRHFLQFVECPIFMQLCFLTGVHALLRLLVLKLCIQLCRHVLLQYTH